MLLTRIVTQASAVESPYRGEITKRIFYQNGAQLREMLNVHVA